jgi:glutamate-5-semialdehyde dehydrogenase
MLDAERNDPDVAGIMDRLGAQAKQAARALARAGTEQKNTALTIAARRLREKMDAILAANARDRAEAEERGQSPALIDRLMLNPERIESMAASLEAVAAFPDPVGRITEERTRPNGLLIQRVTVPLGVIGIIYESRPNVTADAGALCLKSGNAVILRGGSVGFESSHAIQDCLTASLLEAGLPAEAVQSVPTRDRAAVRYLLSEMSGTIDVIVPRGGRSLIEAVQRDARVPVIGHLEGLCHVYVDKDADPGMARDVLLNAKLRRTGICGAAETLLVDRAGADRLLAPLVSALLDAGCEVRGDESAQRADGRVVPASEHDWETEYLDAVISVRVVDGVSGAIEHIGRYGSGHTDSVITGNAAVAERFLKDVDSAIVMHNASTQFADGGEFGMGAEIGISTGRIHARGPVGLEQLTSYKYRVRGAGQVRP